MFLVKAVESGELVIKESLNLFEDPVLFNCKSGAEYLLTQLHPFEAMFKQLQQAYGQYRNAKNEKTPMNDAQNENFFQLLKSLNQFSSLVSECVISGKITSIAAAGVEHGDTLAELCKNTGQMSLSILDKMKSGQALDDQADIAKLNETMSQINKILNELLPKVHDMSKEEIGDLIEQEMHKTTQAIEAAVSKLEVQFLFFFFVFVFAFQSRQDK